MDKTKVKVDFCFYGDTFDLNSITNVLGINPTQTWIKGDHIRGGHFRKDTCWELSTEYEESYDINEQLQKVINILKDKKLEIIEVQKKNKIECKFEIVILIENNEKPAIYFNRNTIQFMNEINSEIDVDYYIYS